VFPIAMAQTIKRSRKYLVPSSSKCVHNAPPAGRQYYNYSSPVVLNRLTLD
jgi:hypothetical protein